MVKRFRVREEMMQEQLPRPIFYCNFIIRSFTKNIGGDASVSSIWSFPSKMVEIHFLNKQTDQFYFFPHLKIVELPKAIILP